MQILFVDESSTPPPPTQKNGNEYFVLGGLVIPEDFWQKLKADLDRLKGQYAISGEIKWRYFAPPKGSKKTHSLSHLDATQKEKLRSELYQSIRKYKSVRLICVVTHVPSAYNRPDVNTQDELYWHTYKPLTERFQYYLQDLERTVGNRVNGIIVCDHRAPKDDERLRGLHQQLLDGSDRKISNYKNLIEGLFIAPSHLSVGIQYADMVAGAVYRKFSANDLRFFDQIKDSFRDSPDGSIEGYGLVYNPKGWEK